tara:strand:- start:2987 stop:3583 length:597 start_codon:yes stop_codon:yes gene_type:complete
MLNKIKLYGELIDICGGNDVFEAVLNSPIDAVRFLISNFKGVEQHIAKNNYQVYCGDECIKEEELNFSNNNCDIKIIPVISGSGNVGRIIAGVVLIGAAFAFSGGAINPLTLGLGGFTGGAAGMALVGNIGLLLVLGGVAGLLSPTPEIPEDEGDPTKSFSFSGVQNTSRAGIAVPVCYGHVLTGSIPISAKISTIDI